MQLMKYDLYLHRIDHIFISHLHGDHYLGLMGLLFTMHLNRRVTDLHLYSHKGLDEIIITQLRHSNSALNFRVIYHMLSPGKQEEILNTKHLTVETIPLSHKIPCTGFLIREKQKPRRIDKEQLPEGLSPLHMIALKNGEDILDPEGNILFKNDILTLEPRRSRSYAYCSDTQYHEGLVEHIKGVDVLYHEATFIEEDKTKAVETMHSTAADAARIAKLAAVQKLVIGHFSARYRDLNPLLNEAKEIFPNTYLAREGESFGISE